MIQQTHTDKRFRWYQTETCRYLKINLSESSLEEKIATFYHVSYFIEREVLTKVKPHLLVKYAKEGETKRLLKHLIDFLIHQQTFQKVAFYGEPSELLMTAIKIANNQDRHTVRLFHSKKDALSYFLET